MDLKQLSKLCHSNSVEKGFYESKDGRVNHEQIVKRLMLVNSELCEAMEALRENGCDFNSHSLSDIINIGSDDAFIDQFREHIKDSFPDELADSFIRLFDLCGWLAIDIDDHVKAKMRYNSLREKKHGKNF